MEPALLVSLILGVLTGLPAVILATVALVRAIRARTTSASWAPRSTGAWMNYWPSGRLE